MVKHRVLLDTFADARRTWDDLVGLQPDVKASGDNLAKGDLIELERRVEAHRAAVDMLVDALETEPADTPTTSSLEESTGISNRESAKQEAQERTAHPPTAESESPGWRKSLERSARRARAASNSHSSMMPSLCRQSRYTMSAI